MASSYRNPFCDPSVINAICEQYRRKRSISSGDQKLVFLYWWSKKSHTDTKPQDIEARIYRNFARRLQARKASNLKVLRGSPREVFRALHHEMCILRGDLQWRESRTESTHRWLLEREGMAPTTT